MSDRITSWKIPSHWTWKTISQLGQVVGGGTPSTKNPSYWGGDINWISPADLTGYTKKKIARGAKSITEEGLKNSSAKIMPAGSIHFSSRAPIGYVVISEEPLATNQGFKSLVPDEGIFNEYIYYYLKGSKQLAEEHASGTTFLELSGKSFGLLPVPMPPQDEQKRIVAKIEELFSELDNGIAALKTAREQLKVYRQAILKHAFEGKFTAQWREENKDELETPEQLLDRIQQEREARYQQQIEEWKQAVEDWESAGKEGKKPRVPSKPKKATLISQPDFETPEQWAISDLISIASESVLGKMLDKQKNIGIERPYLGNVNVRWGNFELDDLKFMRIEDSEVSRYVLRQGDLVVCEGGEPGRCAVWTGDEEQVFIQKALHRVRFTRSYSPYFVFYYLACAVSLERIVKHFTGTTIKHLTGAGLGKVQLPVCSIEEQEVIVSVIDEKISGIDKLDEELEIQLKKSETLRQSILKKAFSGQLVPEEKNADRSNVLPFPNILPGISERDLHAGIISLAYQLHEEKPQYLETFGYVKAEKISHMVEYHLGISLGRIPVKDVAGPNDYPNLRKTSHRADKANWFRVSKTGRGNYVFLPKPGFAQLQDRTRKILGDKLSDVENLLQQMLPMTSRQAEVLATVYAAWNNLLLMGVTPDDERIVTEARENWHESKLEIERSRFFKAIQWMRKNALIPSGRGRLVRENTRSPDV